MLYKHVFDKISTEFREISRIYLNFAAPRPREISEALTKAEARRWTFLETNQIVICVTVDLDWVWQLGQLQN